MKKAHKILLWLSGTAVVIVTATYFGMNYAVNQVMDSLVSSAIQTSPLILDSENNHDAKSSVASPKPSEEPATSTADTNTNKATENTKSATKSSTTAQTSQDKTAVKQPSPAPEKASDTYTPEISTEKAKKAQEEITVKEKALISTILLKKLGASEMSALIKMASGGVSIEEKKEAKKLILQKLSEDEYNELIAIAAKYGLSEGKSYKETSK